LLPDHLAARFPGTLSQIEQVVAAVEQAPSVEAAADRLRGDDITLASALRWVRRRDRDGENGPHTALQILARCSTWLRFAPCLAPISPLLGCKRGRRTPKISASQYEALH
jgi:hypothetical protein